MAMAEGGRQRERVCVYTCVLTSPVARKRQGEGSDFADVGV
jgi:hypothetical protein